MRHGEFKTPGGKLVIVDFEVEDGRIAGMQVNGDFFLEPPEALDAINAALNGVAVDTGEGELAGIVAAGIPEGAELLGFGPEGIATAITRALS